MQHRTQLIAVPLITAASLLLALAIWLAVIVAEMTWFDGVMRVLLAPGYVVSLVLYAFSPEPAVIGQFALMMFGSWIVWTGIVFAVLSVRKHFAK